MMSAAAGGHQSTGNPGTAADGRSTSATKHPDGDHGAPSASADPPRGVAGPENGRERPHRGRGHEVRNRLAPECGPAAQSWWNAPAARSTANVPTARRRRPSEIRRPAPRGRSRREGHVHGVAGDLNDASGGPPAPPARMLAGARLPPASSGNHRTTAEQHQRSEIAASSHNRQLQTCGASLRSGCRIGPPEKDEREEGEERHQRVDAAEAPLAAKSPHQGLANAAV